MGTATKFRRRGAASLCLTWGTQYADHEGLASYVEGTPIATELYRKYGFELVDRFRLELRPWKLGDYWNVCMIRPAKKSA